ncbi:TPA: hypothetical protein DE059_00620 [Candidatus Peribacteria bacterium]|nr:hypothetical protein [Candidatus Peribacteria bacterium]
MVVGVMWCNRQLKLTPTNKKNWLDSNERNVSCKLIPENFLGKKETKETKEQSHPLSPLTLFSPK